MILMLTDLLTPMVREMPTDSSTCLLTSRHFLTVTEIQMDSAMLKSIVILNSMDFVKLTD